MSLSLHNLEPQHYAAFDPGESNGWALFDIAGTPLQMGEAKYGQEFVNLVQELPPCRLFVAEDYRQRPRQQGLHYAAHWDKLIAARSLGYIELKAVELGIPVVFNQPGIMRDTAQAFNLPFTKAHTPNHMAALLHGFYYAWQHLGLMPRETVTREFRKNELKTDEGPDMGVIPIAGYHELHSSIKRFQRRGNKRGGRRS